MFDFIVLKGNLKKKKHDDNEDEKEEVEEEKAGEEREKEEYVTDSMWSVNLKSLLSGSLQKQFANP